MRFVARENVILFIDELHRSSVRVRPRAPWIASNIIKPALRRGRIGNALEPPPSMSTASTSKKMQPSNADSRQSRVEAPSVEEAVQILKGLRPKYETHHKAKLTDEALEAAVRLSDRYITGRFLPDKAIDVMDEAGARARINSMTRPPDVKEIGEKYRHDPRRERSGDYSTRF